MELVPQAFEQFVWADPRFYDRPGLIADETGWFEAARRDAPPGWIRHERELWIGLEPQDCRLPEQGWKIHVSAESRDAARVCQVAWDYCTAHRMPFKFLRSSDAVIVMNSKHADRTASGKLVTIYPVDDGQLTAALRELSGKLDGQAGPYILSDLRYGDGPLYVRYGAFVELWCPGTDGDPVPAIRRPDGELVPDVRHPVFTFPEWAAVPEILRGLLDTAGRADGDLEFPYDVEEALHFSNSGGIYRARDTRDGEQVVLIEARPHCGLDNDGTDAVRRLAAQRSALQRLAGLSCVPRLLDYRTAWEHHFLVEEYIEGTTLLEEIVRRRPLSGDSSPQAHAEYTDWALHQLTEIEAALEQVHARGIWFGDLHPANIRIRPDSSIALVDFELATDLTNHQPRPMAAPGFQVPPGVTGAAADHYQLDCLRLYMFFPMMMGVNREPARLRRLITALELDFPVPKPFGAALLRGLGHGRNTDEADPADLLLDVGEPDWPAIRDSLTAGIMASATPGRDDRLFPGDPHQFESGGLNILYGAAGVLHTLHSVGVAVSEEHVQWLIRAVWRERTHRPGLYDGLHGVAVVLDVLGHRDAALHVFERACTLNGKAVTAGLQSGCSGIGLSLLRFAAITGDMDLHRAAERIARQLANLLRHDAAGAGLVAPSRGGLLYGMTGPALLFLRLHDKTADPEFLDLAAAALRHDLNAAVTMQDGSLQLLDQGVRHTAYLSIGTGGVAAVLHEYLARRPDEALAPLLPMIRKGCATSYVQQPGLLLGRAGFIAVLARLGMTADDGIIRHHIRRLALHASSYEGHLAFPGDKLLRLSTDLATGSAGVLSALAAVFDGPRPVLPCL